MRLYLGHDEREQAAFDVAAKSARRYGCTIIPLRSDLLRKSGMLTRPTDRRGQMWDFNSDAPQSTEFAISRFFVPLLAHSGWCLFADADVVFMEDPHELLCIADESKALHVVQHGDMKLTDLKMDGQLQTSYPRKLWSSVILWNCDHEANRRLNLTTLNQWPGRDLHAFRWLADSEIGSLPAEANWLVGMQPKPPRPIVAHFTEGGPWIKGWEPRPHDDLWKRYAQ